MKKVNFKRFLCLLLVIFIVSAVLIYPHKNTYAIKDFWVELFPRKINTQGNYIFHFKLEKKLDVHSIITLVWPPGTKLEPPLPEDPIERKKRLTEIIESMSIGFSPCSSCQGVPEIYYDKDESLVMKFKTHLEMWPNETDPEKAGPEWTITVPERCGFTNPKNPGSYQAKMSTQAEPSLVKSAPYDVVESRIGVPEGIPEVLVDPPQYKANASYKITFNVGIGGWLKEGSGRIRIRFPKETILTKKTGEISTSAILVNGKVISNSPTVSDTTIVFITPVKIPDGGKVEVIIGKKAGIINPAKPGEYKLEVSTMPGDPEWVESKPYLIKKGEAILNIEPAKVNKIAEYSIAFLLEENMKVTKGDRIIVKFPQHFTVPSIIDAQACKINNTSPSSVNVEDLLVSIYSVIDVATNETLEIKFTKDAQIITPKTPCEVRLGYKLQGFSDFFYTTPVTLLESKLEINEIDVEPKNAKASASYKIKLTLGDNGALKEGDIIGIIFPEDTTIPDDFSDKLNFIKINEEIPKNVFVEKDTIKLTIPLPLQAGMEVNITIDKKFGIRNPLKEGVDYTISVFTSAEVEPTKSDTFAIVPPLPETKILLIGGKEGRENYFIEPPMLGFECSNPSATIYFYWDNKINQVLTFEGDPRPLDTGQYITIIHYWAEDPYGKEDEHTIELKVDTRPPEIVIESPAESRILTNKNPFPISGRTTQLGVTKYGEEINELDKIVYINQTKVPVSDTDGSFSYDLPLTEGENKVLIRAEDIAGNYVEKEYLILLDSISPNVNITSPKEGEVVLTPKLTVKGTTENDAQLLINGEIVFVEEDGSFEYELSLREVGKHTITIEAIDPTGNTTKSELNIYFGYTIVLKIGESSAYINDTEQTLDVPPFIQSGRTLVPFRFIGEALGAKIDFTQDPKTKLVKTVSYELGSIRIILTINEKIADVNGRKVELDVAPIIVQGRTFVPVRFVSENLGASVEWIAQEEKIIIKYPKI